MSDVILDDYVAFSAGAQAAFFIRPQSQSFKSGGTATPVRQITNALNIVPWGEDNRFPQNITRLMSACSIGLAGLEWKQRALYGNGIIPVRVTGYEDEGKKEIIEPLKRTGADAEIWKFIESSQFTRFYIEFLQDWVWFANCWPEAILSKDGKKITGWVHQESCDARYMQNEESGKVQYTLLSKMWSLSKDQYKTFDPNKTIPGLLANNTINWESIPSKYISRVRTLDMYNALDDLKDYSSSLTRDSKAKTVILPVNYPSPNQPFYQVPTWDGSRLAGWIDIAAKIPLFISSLMNNTFTIKYHIEIPEEYFTKRVGDAKWKAMEVSEKRKYKKAVTDEMAEFLKGSDKAGSNFVSYFDTDTQAQGANKEYNRIKITALENKITFNKELLASASVNHEILVSMNINPDVLGASVPSSAYGGNKGGSNIREGKLVYDSMLTGERRLTLEPLYLTRDFNGWDANIQFRHRDTVLTTLDKNKGTEKVLS